MTKKFRICYKSSDGHKEIIYFGDSSQFLIGLDGTIYENYGRASKPMWESVFDAEVTLQQWTGLTDSQGVEIYEGDILFHKNEKQRIKIKFHDGAFCFFGKNHPENGFVLTSSYKDEVSVIGNIFQNPELLEKC